MNIYVLKCFFEASCMSHVMDSQTIGMFKYTLFDCCNLKVFILCSYLCRSRNLVPRLARSFERAYIGMRLPLCAQNSTVKFNFEQLYGHTHTHTHTYTHTHIHTHIHTHSVHAFTC